MTIRRLALASLALAAACTRPPAAGPNVVTITTTEYAFGMPDTLPAGLTAFRLVNQGKELHHASLVRLGGGKTAADFQAGLESAMRSHEPPPAWVTSWTWCTKSAMTFVRLSPRAFNWKSAFSAFSTG